MFPDLFGTVLTPKTSELIASSHMFDGDQSRAEQHFVEGLRRAFVLIREHAAREYPVTIYYAFKQRESEDDSEAERFVPRSTGWETMLAALNQAGFAITGTWPIRTEAANRLRALDSNALASSIVLVCRPRPEDATLVTRREFLRELKAELPGALRKLQRCHIAPVDLAQAAIGPGMAVFSRYSKVIEADGSPMTIRTALSLINQTLDEVLAEQEGEFDSETRWAVAWFEQFGMNEGPYGVAEILSKAKDTAVSGLVAAGMLSAKAGKVRLLSRDELQDIWEPSSDKRVTVWKIVQYLVRSLDKGGEADAAALLQKVGGALGEIAHDLAYRLYTISERKKSAQEALAYNSLVVSWPEITRLAQGMTTKGQGELL